MTQARKDPKTQAYYKAQAEQFAADNKRRQDRAEGKLLFVADYAAIAAAIDRAGFVMTDDEPRGRGYGHWVGPQPADIDDLLLALHELPPFTRVSLIAVLTLGEKGKRP